MPALETVLGMLGAGGGLGGVTAIVKSVLDRSEVRKKLDELEKLTLPALEQRIQSAVEQKLLAALAKLPELERRTTEALVKLEAALQDARAAARAAGRGSRSGTGQTEQLGAAMAEMASLRRDVEGLKGSVDALKQVSPMTVQRVSAIEERFAAFEQAYHDDYGELREKLAGVTGEFKQAMRGKNGGSRASTDSG